MQEEVKDYLETNWFSVSSVGVAWEALKAVLSGRIIQYTSLRKRERESASTIPAVRSSSGDVVTATADINRSFKYFYVDLYSSTAT